MFGLGNRIRFHSEGKTQSHMPDCQLIKCLLWFDQMFQVFFSASILQECYLIYKMRFAASMLLLRCAMCRSQCVFFSLGQCEVRERGIRFSSRWLLWRLLIKEPHLLRGGRAQCSASLACSPQCTPQAE